MRHRHIGIRNGSRVSPLAKLTVEDLAQLRRARHLGLGMNRRRAAIHVPATAKMREKAIHRQSPKRPLKMFLSSVLLTIIIAGTLIFASLSLIHWIRARSTKGPAPLSEAVFVGTEHPVPVKPTPLQTTSAKRKSPNPVTAPAPQTSVAVGRKSRREVEPSSKSAREKVELAREEAEQEREHVEDLYQKDLISEEAYKKGQAEYQREIAKYQDQIAKYRSVEPGTDE
jgi:hypothetical protein